METDGEEAGSRASSRRPRRVTVRDIAKRANVSLGTVSNVLNNPSLVARATRERVLEAITTTGFIPSTAAQQLRGGRSHTVGVVILDVSNPFFTEMVRGAENVLHEHDCVLMLCSTDESVEREEKYLRMLEEHRVDGLLISPAKEDLAALTAIAARGVPTVLMDREADNGELCSVTVDDVRGGELAMAHLLALGHRRVAFVNGPRSIRQCVDRRRGAVRALRARNVKISDVLVELSAAALSIEHGEEAGRRLAGLADRPSAVMCANDLLALGVLRALADAGVAVPSEIAVVGYDDVSFASMLSPSLTSVRQPKYELGRAAAHLLLEEINDASHLHRGVRYEPELVVRASSVPH